MKYAFCGGKLLDGTQEMQPREGLVLRTDGDRITDIVPEGTDLTGYEVVNLKGGYLMPGLINMHVHLAGSGKPQKKQRDNEKLVKTILSTGLTRKVAYGMVAGFAKEELFSGVTTIRTVGGLADFDTRLRDDIRAGRRVGPRILAANEGISVPGGHMAGSVAVAAHTIDEALAQLEKGRQQGVDLVKLMITGGVLDAKEKGVPGELKMPPEMVKVVCERAHEMGYTVAAHVESPEGVRVALENGVDSIEHGAKPDADILRLFRERGAFLCTTISPALPYALFDRSVSNASEVERYNGNVVFEGIIDCAKAALSRISRWCWATTWAARGSPSTTSGGSCTTSTSMWGCPTPSLCTPPPAAAPSWRVSVRRPARWSRERRRTSSLRRRIHWPTYGRCAMQSWSCPTGSCTVRRR